jgi:acetyltransferase EpsM
MEPSAKTITIPLINPNEPESLVAHLAVNEGQYVSKGAVLCVLETTKSTVEVVAEIDGYIISLQVSENDLAHAGSLLCYLAQSEDWQPEISNTTLSRDSEFDQQGLLESELPEGLRITNPALQLATSKELDLSLLPKGQMVTTEVVEEFLKQTTKPAFISKKIDTRKLIVYGGGGHGKSIIETIRSQAVYDIVGVIDDGLVAGDRILDVDILGGSEELSDLLERGIGQAVNAVGGVGDIKSRIRVFELIKHNGFSCPTVAHASAVIEPSAKILSGVQVLPLSYVGSAASIGFGVIINTSAVVSHDCILADYVNISPGAMLAGGVEIGYATLIGMGVTINLNVTIGENVRIGNGATVKSDVPDGTIIKAGKIWPD